jgi:hypothetical protein
LDFDDFGYDLEEDWPSSGRALEPLPLEIDAWFRGSLAAMVRRKRIKFDTAALSRYEQCTIQVLHLFKIEEG